MESKQNKELELKQIKELMSAMERSNISKLSLKQGDFKLELEHSSKFPPAMVEASHKNAFQVPYPAWFNSSSDQPIDKKETEKKAEPGLCIESPMVGTFYTSPAPEAPSFVKVGDHVQEDSIVCIVEAMKVMNEVKAGVSGLVKKVLIDDGSPVEFGTKLFLIDSEMKEAVLAEEGSSQESKA